MKIRRVCYTRHRTKERAPFCEASITSDEYYDSALCSRLNQALADYSQSEISRKTGVSQQSIHRYLHGAKVPAAFLMKLSDTLGLNPSWLLAGKGSPMLTDIPDQTREIANEVLDLVNAMNAASKMQLGALTKKQQNLVLRDLNEALERHQSSQSQVNSYSAKVFEQMLDELDLAVAKSNFELAHSIARAAAQLSRICNTPELHLRWLELRSVLYYREGHYEDALNSLEEVFVRSITGAGYQNPHFYRRSINYIWTLRQCARIVDARSACRALVEFAKERMSDDEFASVLYQQGTLDIDLGELERGTVLIQRALPDLADDSRLDARVMLLRAQLWAGALSFREAMESPPDTLDRCNVLAGFAILCGEPEVLEQALNVLVGSDETLLPKNDAFVVLMQSLYDASRGEKSALKSYRNFVSTNPDERLHTPRWKIAHAIAETKIAALLNDKPKTTASFERETKLVQAFGDERNLGMLLRTMHYSHILRLTGAIPRKGKSKDSQKRAVTFFDAIREAGYKGLHKASGGHYD